MSPPAGGDNLRSGGRVLLDQLRIHGADTAFCVPGESYLAALDAFHDVPEVRLVVCRQEGGAAMMADAYGKLTGNPGICFVTRGPGATNASPGVHIAFQDSTPMILFVGQVSRAVQEREAFQELDYRRVYGELAKWVAQIDDAARIPEMVSRAFYTATSGRPGPVVLALPEDMLRDRVSVTDAKPAERVLTHPGAQAMERLREMLAAAKRPFMIVGGSGWDTQACAQIQAFAQANHLASGTSFRTQDLFDNSHACYAGHVGLGLPKEFFERIQSSDLLLVVGARLGELTTSDYTLVEPPFPSQTLVHVHADANELGRVYQPALAINASMRAFAAAASELAPVDAAAWSGATAAAHQEYLTGLRPVKIPGELQMGEVMDWLQGHLPDDAIICNGAGNYTVWVHRFHQFRRFRTQLAPTSGSMGYGTPAAVAAKLLHPERTVLSFAGDGCFLMNGQELATAVQYGLNIIILVINNGMYGTIRMHQERHYPGRTEGTGLQNPNFADLARAYGAHGETVERTGEFAPAFERATNAGRPALIELRIDPEAITPKQSLSEIRAEALARKP